MQYYYDPVDPIVETKYGKLRGYTYGEVNHFLGIKYADAKRFKMPVDVSPWEGVRDARKYGPIMLQMRAFNPMDRFEGMNQPWKESEDCQYLNIWAQRHDDGKKRPVFVYMHGGGFFSGSSIESNFFDGFNMAKKGDVVMVTMNHRLNFLGYMNLEDYGEEFHNSVNVGVADLVICLKWIHENIEAFGGDPDNVTICGHSGGGGKVLCMYQIEEAKKYFSRGIVLSGTLDGGPQTDARQSKFMAKAILDKLGISKENIDKIYDLSYQEILDGYKAALPEIVKAGISTGTSPVTNDYFGGFPNEEDFMDYSLDKPMLISSVLGEFNFKVAIPDNVKETATQEDKIRMIKDRFGTEADALLELFKKTYPTHDIIDLMYLDADFRRPTYETALKKARKSPNANTYMMLLTYNFPCHGRITPWHGSELPYIFLNPEMAPVCNEPVYGENLAKAFEAMMLNFIRTGNPNNEYMPEWKPVSEEHPYTMVIDKEIELREAHDTDLIKLYKKACPPLEFHPEIK